MTGFDDEIKSLKQTKKDNEDRLAEIKKEAAKFEKGSKEWKALQEEYEQINQWIGRLIVQIAETQRLKQEEKQKKQKEKAKQKQQAEQGSSAKQVQPGKSSRNY